MMDRPVQDFVWAVSLHGVHLPRGMRSVLLRRWQEHQDVTARNLLVTGSLHVIYRLIRRHTVTAHPEEHLSLGALGVMRAADRYDAAFGIAFSAYVNNWIFMYLARHAADDAWQLKVPRHLQNIMHSVSHALYGSLNGDLDCRLSTGQMQQLAAQIGSSPEVMQQVFLAWQRSRRAVYCSQLPPRRSAAGQDHEYLEGPAEDCPAQLRVDESLYAGQDPQLLTEYAELRQRLYLRIGQLPGKLRRLIIYRYGLHDGQEHTLQRCADDLHLGTREGVRQMQVRALRELRALLRSDVSWHGRQLAAEGWAAAI